MEKNISPTNTSKKCMEWMHSVYLKILYGSCTGTSTKLSLTCHESIMTVFHVQKFSRPQEEILPFKSAVLRWSDWGGSGAQTALWEDGAPDMTKLGQDYWNQLPLTCWDPVHRHECTTAQPSRTMKSGLPNIMLYLTWHFQQAKSEALLKWL